MNLAVKGPMIVAALMSPLITVHAAASDPLPPETRLATLAGAAAATEETFTIASPTDLTITLTDLQVPAALSTASVVLTQGGAIVGANPPGSGSATLAAPATTAAFSIAGVAGAYTLRVFGAPGANSSIGAFQVCVAPKASPTSCIAADSLVGTLSTPAAASNSALSTVSETLTVTAAGNYLVSYADDAFPGRAGYRAERGAVSGQHADRHDAFAVGYGGCAHSGTYTLLAFAEADPTVKAGLYGITVTGPAGVPPLLGKTYPSARWGRHRPRQPDHSNAHPQGH